MNKLSKRVFLLLMALALVLLNGCSARVLRPLTILPALQEAETQESLEPSDAFFGLGVYEPEGFVFSGRVFIAGDSTVCSTYSQNRVQALDLMGWGKYLGDYLTPETSEEGVQGVTVYNYALSGGSSRSYLESSGYDHLLKYLSKGDYLLIQFGHNDQRPDDPELSTSAALSREQVSDTGADETGTYSFEWILYEKYIKLATDVGAVPILVSPPVELDLETGGPNLSGHVPYQEAMRALAEECSVPFVDLTELSRAYYAELSAGGVEATSLLHAFTDETKEEIDIAHLSRYGAFCIAGLVARELSDCEIALSRFVIEPSEPILPRA